MGLDLRINKIAQTTDREKDVVKYREKHPHCRYCIHERGGGARSMMIFIASRAENHIFLIEQDIAIYMR